MATGSLVFTVQLVVPAAWQDEMEEAKTPARDCPACPARRHAHDAWGCADTGCPMPIALITARPR